MVSISIRYFRVGRQLLLRGKGACPLVVAERGPAPFFCGYGPPPRLTAMASYTGLAWARRRDILTVLSRGTRAGGERKTCHTALCTGRATALRSRRPIGTSPYRRNTACILHSTNSPVGSVDGSSSEHSAWVQWRWVPRAFSLAMPNSGLCSRKTGLVACSLSSPPFLSRASDESQGGHEGDWQSRGDPGRQG